MQQRQPGVIARFFVAWLLSMTRHPSHARRFPEPTEGIYFVTLRVSFVIECFVCFSVLVTQSHRRVPVACYSGGNLRLAWVCPRLENGEVRF